MPVRLERRMSFPPDIRSIGRVRRIIHDMLTEVGDGDPGGGRDAPGLVDDVVLLTSELCENAVLHAGTAFDLAVTVDDDEVTVAVTDRGPGALELHLAEPRQRYGRAATHGRGLSLIARLATTWGTRHDADGRHTVWFALAGRPGSRAGPATDVAPEHERSWTAAEQARWLLHVPASLARRLSPVDLVRELAGRLRDIVDAAAVVVEIDRGEGSGPRELARAGGPPGALAPHGALDVPLPTTTGLQGTIRLVLRDGADPARARELTELIAPRIAITAESQWLHDVDQRRRAWTAYLAEASELLGQSLDLELTVALVPQLVVPRLGSWCAVLLPEPSRRLRLAAMAHADEDRLPELRAVLDPDAVPGPPPQLRARLASAQRDAPPSWFSDPAEGVAVALRAAGASTGVLLVGRPAGRQHTPEDLMLIDDIARRAALAVHNAQTVGEHVRVSQMLQAALLPRALPQVPELDFAAEYLPASTGADVGGDFYDVVEIDPERWLVTIGDVCGKGARAAARTGLVRDVLRALVREGRPLMGAIEMLNDVMVQAGDPQQFCTLAAAILTRERHGGRSAVAVELVLAGHVRPVVVRTDGTAQQVGRYGTALGLYETIDLHCTRHVLTAGETLLFYTDGVTECRRGLEQFDDVRLLEAAASASGTSAARLVTTVREAVQRFASDRCGDDMALLAVRAEPRTVEQQRGGAASSRVTS